MFVKQLSVFIENSPGRLADITRLLAEHGIDLLSMSIADTSSFGILRFITADIERTKSVVEEAGYTACVNHVLVVPVEDKPGGLAAVLSVLSENDVSVEYMYSFHHSPTGQALIVLRVSDYHKGCEVLEKDGLHIYTQEEITKFY